MATDTTAGTTTEVPTPVEAPAPATPSVAPADAATSTETKPEGDVTGLKSALAAERTAAREANAELARLRAQVQEFENAKLSETERLQRERDEYKAQLDTFASENAKRAATDALVKAAEAAGAGKNAAALARLADSSKYNAEADNAAELIESLRTEFEHLFQVAEPAPQTPGMGNADAGTGTAPTVFTREQVAAMNDAEYKANRALILASMSSWS